MTADQVFGEATVIAMRPRIARPSADELAALIDSLDHETMSRRAERIDAELIPMLARMSETARAGVVEDVCDRWKYLKPASVLRDVAKAEKAMNPAKRQEEDVGDGEAFIVRDSQLYHLVRDRGGHRYERVANFEARILRQTVIDSGADRTLHLTIRGRLCNGKDLPEIRIPAADFPGLRWLMKQWGGEPSIEPGNGMDRICRAGIQHLSGADLPTETVRAFTGWMQRPEGWVYLHGGGGITADGLDETVRVELADTLRFYSLPEPPTGPELVHAIRTSLATLGIAPLAVTAPMFAATWRAVLPVLVDYAMLVVGRTTSGKSEIAAIYQKHWGAAFSRLRLPGNWISTINMLEAQTFAIQHAIFTIDDLVTGNTRDERKETEKSFDRLIRSIGNQSGRGRLESTQAMKATKSPRGMVVLTAEDVPAARQSAIARLVKVEVAADSVNWENLRAVRAAGDNGVLAQAMAGFLRWLAPRLDRVLETFGEERDELTTWVQRLGPMMRRTPMNVADLLIGLRAFLAFAIDSGAITEAQKEEIWTSCTSAIAEVAVDQGQAQAARDPVVRFLTVLKGAFATEKAHLGSMEGGAPDPRISASWGWRLRVMGSGAYKVEDWQSYGERIGWINDSGTQIYLDPENAYRVVNEIATKGGEGIPVGFRRLQKALFEAGRLAETEYQSRKVYTARKCIGGVRLVVLVLNVSSLDDPETCPTCPEKNPTCPADQVSIIQFIQELTTTLGNLGNLGNGKTGGSYAREETVDHDRSKTLVCEGGVSFSSPNLTNLPNSETTNRNNTESPSINVGNSGDFVGNLGEDLPTPTAPAPEDDLPPEPFRGQAEVMAAAPAGTPIVEDDLP